MKIAIVLVLSAYMALGCSLPSGKQEGKEQDRSSQTLASADNGKPEQGRHGPCKGEAIKKGAKIAMFESRFFDEPGACIKILSESGDSLGNISRLPTEDGPTVHPQRLRDEFLFYYPENYILGTWVKESRPGLLEIISERGSYFFSATSGKRISLYDLDAFMLGRLVMAEDIEIFQEQGLVKRIRMNTKTVEIIEIRGEMAKVRSYFECNESADQPTLVGWMKWKNSDCVLVDIYFSC